jgi:hypothetical protein
MTAAKPFMPAVDNPRGTKPDLAADQRAEGPILPARTRPGSRQSARPGAGHTDHAALHGLQSSLTWFRNRAERRRLGAAACPQSA